MFHTFKAVYKVLKSIECNIIISDHILNPLTNYCAFCEKTRKVHA